RTVMTTISVPISEERLQQLQELAQRAKVSPEELARAGLEDWLRQPREDFAQAARYVLQKNAELYRRLAWCGFVRPHLRGGGGKAGETQGANAARAAVLRNHLPASRPSNR